MSDLGAPLIESENPSAPPKMELQARATVATFIVVFVCLFVVAVCRKRKYNLLHSDEI
jgi:hypothetical protein